MEAVNAMNSSESSAESEPEVKPKKRKADSSDESDYKPAKTTKKRKGSSDSDDWKETKKKKAKYTGFTRPYKLSPDLSSLMGAKEMPRHEVVKKVWAIIKVWKIKFDLMFTKWSFRVLQEKNLYDPKNKQYAICDAGMTTITDEFPLAAINSTFLPLIALEKVIGVKR